MVLGRNEPGKHVEPARADREVVISAAERHAAQLVDAQPAAFGAELVGELLEHDDAVGDALQMVVSRAAGAVVEHQDGAIAIAEELLQRQDLSAIAQRFCAIPQLRQGIDDHPLGLKGLNGRDRASVVSPSSSSDGLKTVSCESLDSFARRNQLADFQGRESQPWLRATLAISARDSDRVM